MSTTANRGTFILVVVFGAVHALCLGSGKARAQDLRQIGYEAEQVGRYGDRAQPWLFAVRADGSLYHALPAQRAVRITESRNLSSSVVDLAPPGPRAFPRYLGWVADTLWATDWSGGFVSFFDGSFNPLRTDTVTMPGRAGTIESFRIIGMLPGARMAVETTASLLSMALASGADVPEAHDPNRPYTADLTSALPIWVAENTGSVLDTVALLSTRNLAAVIRARNPRPGTISMSQTLEPFGDNPLFALDPAATHFVVVERPAESTRAEYVVHRIDLTGDTLSSQAYPIQRVPLESAWADRAAAAEARTLGDDSPAGIADVRRQMYVPVWLPPVSTVVASTDGTIWVGRERAPGSTVIRYEILNPEGSRLGEVHLDATWHIVGVTATGAWAIEQEEDQVVNVWHIRLLSSGP